MTKENKQTTVRQEKGNLLIICTIIIPTRQQTTIVIFVHFFQNIMTVDIDHFIGLLITLNFSTYRSKKIEASIKEKVNIADSNQCKC